MPARSAKDHGWSGEPKTKTISFAVVFVGSLHHDLLSRLAPLLFEGGLRGEGREDESLYPRFFTNAAMKKFIGNISVSVQGNTSEAGLRELLFSDAINVLFVEAEGENEHAQQRIDSVLQLMRSASSSDGGMIVKGSGSGAKTYNIRSCFAFCSIVPQAVHGSDLRRVTNLELKRGVLSESDFEALNSDFHDVATDDYVLGFQTRIINRIPSLLKTISIFTRAITEKLKSRAMGDQSVREVH